MRRGGDEERARESSGSPRNAATRRISVTSWRRRGPGAPRTEGVRHCTAARRCGAAIRTTEHSTHMLHARDHALDSIEHLLVEIRRNPALVERKRGVFYRGSRACLHFHEDPAGIFADVNMGERWERLPVNGVTQERALLEKLASLPLRRPPRAS